MTGEVMTSVLIMAVLILMSAYFSATETAFSSLNRTRLRTLAEKGNRKASLALILSEQYDRMLSTILIGNNIVNIATASIGTVLFVHLYGDAGATISTVVITIVVLIFGEISPKSLAKENPERFAMFSARILKACIWLLTPINFLFTQWKKLLSKIFHVSESRKMTQDELLMLVEEVRQDGSVDVHAIGLIVFKDRKKLAELDTIVHERIPRALAQKMAATNAEIIGLDAIKLIESGLGAICDATVAVTAPEEVRVKRIMARDSITEEYARSRIAAQKDADYFRAQCDYEFVNDLPTAEKAEHAAEVYINTIINNLKEETER